MKNAVVDAARDDRGISELAFVSNKLVSEFRFDFCFIHTRSHESADSLDTFAS